MRLVRASAAILMCLAALWGAAHVGVLPSALGWRAEAVSAGPVAHARPPRFHWRLPVLR